MPLPKLSCLALLMLAGTAAQAALSVVTTTTDLGALAETIGGPAVRVTTLARATEDPHFVDARPGFIRVLNRAEVLVEGGAGLEQGWLPPLVNNARNSKILPGAPGHFSAAEGLALLEVPQVLDRSQGDVHAAGNPHFLLDPRRARQVAENLAARFAAIDPENAPDYRQRAAEFTARLDEKNAAWKKRLAPFRGAGVVTYHKSYDYFLQAFGLNLAGTIEPKPGIEPSSAHLVALVGRMKKDGVKLILAEPNRPDRICRRVASESGARLLRLPILTGGTDGTGDYLSLIEHNVAAIEHALSPGP